jgi:hypothetical protein
MFFAAMFGFLGILGVAALPAMGQTSLNLTAHPPDISVGYLNVGYNALSGSFTASGFPLAFNISGSSTPDYPTIDDGRYSLSVQLTQTGQPVPGTGSLDITGSIPGLTSSGILLTGELSQFGYQSGGGDIFEFVFDDLRGDLAPYYGGYGGETSVILDAVNAKFNGNFADSFTASPALSVSDNSHYVPEPSTAILLLAALAFGLPAWACHRWRRVPAAK